MFYSVAGVTTALCSGLKAGQKAVLRLFICTIIGLFTLLWSTPGLAVPAGTVISNTASISYSVSGVPGLPLSSNNDQFTVTAPANITSATMGMGPFSDNIFAGTPQLNTITINNTGSAPLSAQQLSITAPLNGQISLNGSGISLISSSNTATTTTSLFSLPNLTPGDSQNIQLTLTPPRVNVASSQAMVIEHHANSAMLSTQTIMMNLMPRTLATLETLEYSHSSRATPVIINATSYKDASSVYIPLPTPALPDALGTLVTDGAVTLEPANTFSHRQTMFIRIIDPDHNLDNTVQESIDVQLNIQDSNEHETLQLRETGITTGIFTGYVTLQKGAASPNDGDLNVHINSKLNISYTDDIDGNDNQASTVLIDPYGEIF
ncbi:MAG: hypothetical protein U1B30_02400, partial [Pseudomonadota bacterium]|nr:hypothetical protein [Pseudomonadota bacterium]